jgi:hypothetical protein
LNTKVSDNQIWDADDMGISVSQNAGGGAVVRGVELYNNRIDNSANEAIRLLSGSAISIRGGELSNSQHASDGKGIDISSADSTLISGVLIHHNISNGIYIGGGNKLISIVGNHVYQNGSGGIQLGGTSGNEIQHPLIVGNHSYLNLDGFRLSYSDHAALFANYAFSNSDIGFQITDSDTLRFNKNSNYAWNNTNADYSLSGGSKHDEALLFNTFVNPADALLFLHSWGAGRVGVLLQSENSGGSLNRWWGWFADTTANVLRAGGDGSTVPTNWAFTIDGDQNVSIGSETPLSSATLYIKDTGDSVSCTAWQSTKSVGDASRWWICADTTANEFLIGADGTTPVPSAYPIRINASGIDTLKFDDGSTITSGTAQKDTVWSNSVMYSKTGPSGVSTFTTDIVKGNDEAAVMYVSNTTILDSLWGCTTAGTVTFNIEYRATKDGAGTEILSTDRVEGTTCTTWPADSFAVASVDAGNVFVWNVADTSGGAIGWTSFLFYHTSGDVLDELSDTDLDTKIQLEESADEDTVRIDTGGSERVRIGAGVTIGSPTGGDKGAGTINATAIYDDGVQLGTVDTLRISFVIATPTASSDYSLTSFPANITIQEIRVLCTGGTNLVGGLDEADANGGSPVAVDSDITATAGTTATDDGSLTNATIDADDILQWHTTSISGTPTSVTVTIYYTED